MAVGSSAGAAVNFHQGGANTVAGYLLVERTPLGAKLTADDIKRAQACKQQVLQKDPSLDTPAGAKQVSTLINECLGSAGPVFTLPWLGSMPINTYLD